VSVMSGAWPNRRRLAFGQHAGLAMGADHEQALAGFWPGNDKLPEPAFVAYVYPEPPGCRTALLEWRHESARSSDVARKSL